MQYQIIFGNIMFKLIINNRSFYFLNDNKELIESILKDKKIAIFNLKHTWKEIRDICRIVLEN